MREAVIVSTARTPIGGCLQGCAEQHQIPNHDGARH